jgi:choline dehydrogenase-like flavoprotein
MANGASTSDILQARVAPANFQLYGNLAAIPQWGNCVTLQGGTTRFGLPRTNIATPQPLFNQGSADSYCALMRDVLSTMGCSQVSSGTYPQRGDHVACTTRMASQPGQGVVNEHLQVFGVDNLFIAGNSSIPTLPAANPTLTLVAMLYKFMLGADSPAAKWRA